MLVNLFSFKKMYLTRLIFIQNFSYESTTDLIEFDDDEAIKFILNRLPKSILPHVTDDDVQYVLDLICDFYEKQSDEG